MTNQPIQHNLVVPISIQKIRCKEREITLKEAISSQSANKERLEQEIEKNTVYCELLSKQIGYHIDIFCRHNNIEENISNWNINARVLDTYRLTLKPPLFIGVDDDHSGHLKSCSYCFHYCLWNNSLISTYPQEKEDTGAISLRDQIIKCVNRFPHRGEESFLRYYKVFPIEKWPPQ